MKSYEVLSPLSKQAGYPGIKTHLKFLHSYPLRSMQQNLSYSISTELAMSYGLFQVLESDWFLQYSSTVLMFETTAIAIRCNSFYEQLPASEGTAEWNNKCWEQQDEQQQMLRKQMVRNLQQDEKAQPFDFTTDYTYPKWLILYNHMYSLCWIVSCVVSDM